MFTLTIKTDNAAFEDGREGEEVARILREVAEATEQGVTHGETRDLNGNRVGSWELTDGEG